MIDLADALALVESTVTPLPPRRQRPLDPCGLAAEAGVTYVATAGRPRVAILSTVSKLVRSEMSAAFGQTRHSSEPMLTAAVQLLGAEPIPLGLVIDRPEAIRAAVAQGLAADVLLLSGGVSAGDLDLVPEALRVCGVEKVFHKVRHKPGKPVWFGIHRRAASASSLVFVLPEIPAGSLVCFDLFVRPALAILAGRPRSEWHLPRARARLTGPAKAAADRPLYLPCRLAGPPDAVQATPLQGNGSCDLRGFAGSSGYIALPANGKLHETGTIVDIVLRP